MKHGAKVVFCGRGERIGVEISNVSFYYSKPPQIYSIDMKSLCRHWEESSASL